MKEKLLTASGIVGVILWYVVSAIVYVIPFVMIGASFWLNLLFFAIVFFFPPSSIVFWIWGLVCAIQGPQDVWAIIYYVLFAIAFIPFFVNIILNLLGKIALASERKRAKNEQEMPNLDIVPDARVNWRD